MADTSRYTCTCGATYPIRDGVVSFREDDPFYEGAYDATLNFVPNEKSWRDRMLLYFVNQHMPWAIYKHIREPGVILDVACGGGMRYLSTKGTAVGLDVSAASLRRTAGFYAAALQADAFNVPLPDGSCRYIVTQFFFEHVEPTFKPRLLAEWRRLLAEDGRLILLFDCAADNAFFRLARSDSDLFQESFIERDHHYGLQRASDNLAQIHAAGFHIIEQRTSGKSVVQHAPKLGWIAEYPNKPLVFRGLVWLAQRAVQHRLSNWLFAAAVVAIDDALERVLPLDAATALLVVATPQGGSTVGRR
jgi:SAM-dependent methyltransferase